MKKYEKPTLEEIKFEPTEEYLGGRVTGDSSVVDDPDLNDTPSIPGYLY